MNARIFLYRSPCSSHEMNDEEDDEQYEENVNRGHCYMKRDISNQPPNEE